MKANPERCLIQHAMLIGMPVRKAGEEHHTAIDVGMENVRAAAMDAQADGAQLIEGNAGDVVTLVDEMDGNAGVG